MRAHVLRNIWADFARFRLGVAWKLQDGYLVDIAMGFPVRCSPGRQNVEDDHSATRVLVTLAKRGGERSDGPYRMRYREPDPAFGTRLL